MPVPKPNAGEKQNDFVSRCIRAEQGSGREQKQIQAICFQAWQDRFKTEEAVMEPTSKRLIETIVFSGAEFVESSDGNPRLIKGVVLLGGTARRGKDSYDYPVRTMEAAVKGGKYDNCRCFINHPSETEMKNGRRDLMNLAGVCRNPRVEDAKIKGDVRVLDDAYGDKFWNIARHMPEAASCSHIADGTMKREGDKMFVEEIKEVLSVDLVVQGATTMNVFESGDYQKGTTMEYGDIKIDDLRIKRPDLVKSLVEEGAKSRDEEVKTLTESNKELKGKLDEHDVREKQASRKAAVAKLLEECKLPKLAKTDLFREQLENIEGDNFEAQAKKLIEDRLAIVGGVKNMGSNDKDGAGNMGRRRSLRESRQLVVG
jgi:hypothetical protein